MKHSDTHGSPFLTRWVHHHRRLAVWILRFLVAGVTSLLYYLRNQKRIIEQEATEGRAKKY